jgi:hypothetical protein
MTLKFEEWGQHVLAELTRQHIDHLEVRKDLNEIKVQIAMLKVRASVWGAVAGSVFAAVLTRLL